jgi:hypothetical protein
MGDAYGTWRRNRTPDPQLDPTFWPEWLSADIPGLQLFTVSYDAPVSNWLGTSMALQDRAVNVLEVLFAEDALRKHPTYFICHSLGGLLLKQILLSLKEQEERSSEARELLTSIKKIVFIATPHTGSRKATFLSQLSFLAWPTAIARSLVANDPALRQINVSYRGLADDRRELLSHRIFYETQATIAGGIVDEASSDPGLHAVPIPIDANHITIAKPKDRSDLLYTRVREFLQEGLPPLPAGHSVPENLPALTYERSWNLVPKVVRLALLSSMVAATYFYLVPEHFVPPDRAAQEVAQSYLALVDRGDFEAAWSLWDPLAKEGWGSFETYKQVVENNLGPLGAVVHRDYTLAEATQQSPSGSPHGLYSGAAYKTKFASASECRAERVTLRSGREREWRVFGHFLYPTPIPC